MDIGDRVQEGQLLATLEIPEAQDDLTRAAAAIDEANAELTTARDELQRAQTNHDIAHLSYSRILDVSKKSPVWCPNRKWTKRIPAIWEPRRRSPSRSRTSRPVSSGSASLKPKQVAFQNPLSIRRHRRAFHRCGDQEIRK